MSSRGNLRAAQTLLLLLGFSLLIVGAYIPQIVRTVNASYAQTVIVVSGGGSVSSITVAIASVDYVQCSACTNLYQEVSFGNTFQLGGQLNIQQANLQVQLNVQIGSNQYQVINLYVTDNQGKYGWAFNGGAGDGNLMQLKPDGVYIKGSRAVSVTLTSGTTVAFHTQISAISSSEADVKITGSGIVPTGTVVMKDGNGQSFTLTASSNVQAKSPLQFTVTITQGASNVQSMNLYYWVYGTTGSQQTQPLTTCGTNMYCGTLNLQPGTYVVKVNILPSQGQPIVLLSLIGDFSGVSTPIDISYYIGLLGMLAGAGIVLGAAFMPVGRRFP